MPARTTIPSLPALPTFHALAAMPGIVSHIRNTRSTALPCVSQSAPGGSKSIKPAPVKLNAERCYDIFPSGIDQPDEPGSPDSFNLRKIRENLTEWDLPHLHVEDIVVESASYCKQDNGSLHEFIILAVLDRRAQWRNFLILDRTSDIPVDKTSEHLITAFGSSPGKRDAADRLIVSYDGDLKRLLKHFNASSHTVLERLTFHQEPLLLWELVDLSYVVSREHIEYDALHKQCYWFAGLIWDCVLTMRPKAELVVPEPNRRGKFRSYFRQKVKSTELKAIYEKSKCSREEIRLKFNGWREADQNKGEV